MSGLNLNRGNQERNEQSENGARRQENNMNQQSRSYSDTQRYDPFQGTNILTSGNFGQLVHSDTGSETFNKMVEHMNEVVKSSGVADKIDIFPLAREIHTDLSFSVIIVARNARVPMGPGLPQHKYVMAQILIIEASGEVPRAVQHEANSRNPFWVTPTISQAYNSLLIKYAKHHMLTTKYSGQDLEIDFIDPIVIRKDLDMTDAARVRTIAEASTAAVEVRAQVRVPGFQDFNFVTKLGGTGGELVLPVAVTVQPEDTQDLTGRLFHADAKVTVDVEAAGARQNDQPYFNASRTARTICSTSVGIDLVPVDTELLIEENGRRDRRDRDPIAAWAPRLIARRIDQFMVRTPAGIMFALASMSELARNRTWAQAFRGQRGQAGTTNLRNIGYLNIEANLLDEEGRGSVINTAASDFSDEDLGRFLDKTVTKSPILAVDCLTSGSQAYLTTALYNAARGNKERSARANMELMHSMNCATNGELERLIDLDTPVVDNEGSMVHVGVFLGENGKMRDIFEVDNFLGITVRGGTNNPDLAREWMGTYTNTNNSEERNMADRLNILNGVVEGGVVVNDTALRVELSGEVVSAFVEACKNAKLPLLPRTGEADLFTTTRYVRAGAERTLFRGTGFGSARARESGSRTNRYAADRY